MAVVALDNLLAAYYAGKQIALHRISYQRTDMVVNPQHYRRLTAKQSMGVENPLLAQDNVIDFSMKIRNLSQYDEVLYECACHHAFSGEWQEYCVFGPPGVGKTHLASALGMVAA